MRDLDPVRQAEWEPDKWVRAFRSGFMFWLGRQEEKEPGFTSHPGAPLRYHFGRLATSAVAETRDGEAESVPEGAADIETGDLDTGRIRVWTEDQLARAWRSRVLQRLPMEFWDALADPPADGGEEE